jgi:ABC-2 type transport system permease protein
VYQQAGQGSYLQFVAPGVIGMSVLFTSIFSGIGCSGIGSSDS